MISFHSHIRNYRFVQISQKNSHVIFIRPYVALDHLFRKEALAEVYTVPIEQNVTVMKICQASESMNM